MADADNQDSGRPTVDQLTLARSMCGNNRFLLTNFEEFLNKKPSRTQMDEYIKNMLDPAQQAKLLQVNVLRICESVGITEPSGTDKLLALQIGLLQEQNEALSRLANGTAQAAARMQQQPSVFGPVLAALLIDKAL